MNANNFTLIHGYIGTNILQIKRTFLYIYGGLGEGGGYVSDDGSWVSLSFYIEYYMLYSKFGGNILI